MAKQKQHSVIGIDLGSVWARGIVVVNDPDSKYKEVLATHKLPIEGITAGNITDPSLVAETLTELVAVLEEKHETKIDATLVSLGGSYIQSHHANGYTLISRGDGTVSDIDIENALTEAQKSVYDIKNKAILHTIPLRYKLDGQEVSGNILGLRGHKLEIKALFVTYPKQYLTSVKEALSKARIDVADIIAGPIAESIPLLSKKQKLAGVGLVHIGAETTSILVYENNAPLLVSVIPVGGNSITKDIALGLKVSLEDAEDIKCGTTAALYSKRRVDEIIEARIEDMCDKINKELDHIHRKELLPAGIVVCGDSAFIPRIDYMMRYTMRLPIKIIGNELLHVSKGTLDDASWARSYGLCFLAPDIEESLIIAKAFTRGVTAIKRFFVQFLP